MTLLDQFGRPIKTIEKKPESRVLAAATIRDRWSGYPSNNLTPQRLATILKEADAGDVTRQMELFEEMEEKDTHLSGELLKRKNAVKGISYDVIPYEKGSRLSAYRERKTEGKADKVCDFCRDVIFSLTDFDDVIFDMLDVIGKGLALSEIVWGVSGRYVVVEDIKWIHQKKLTFVDTLYPKIITEENVTGEEVPPFKAIYHRHKARSGHDTRAGLNRVCAWMYLFKNYAIKDWVAFMEVFGLPLRLGKYDPGASQNDKDALISAIQSIGSDAAGIISKSTEIEFVESVSRTSENPFKALSSFANGEQSKAIIGGTLTAEAGEKGSYSLGKVHNEVRLDLVVSDSKALAVTIRDQLLRPLVGYNFGWDTPVPWFHFDLPKSEDTELLSRVYKNLAEMGQPLSQEHVSERFKVPLPGEGETLLVAPGGRNQGGADRVALKGDPSVAPTQGDRQRGKSGQNDLFGSGPDTLDVLTDKILSRGDLGPLVDPVKKLLDEVESLDEFRGRLLEMWGHMDDRELGEMMAQAFTLANLGGRYDALR